MTLLRRPGFLLVLALLASRCGGLAEPTPACAFNVTVSASSIPAAGGTGTVTVAPVSSTTCSWSVSSTSDWLTFTGTTSGTQAGSFGYVATPNTGASRSANVMVTWTDAGRAGSAQVAFTQAAPSAAPPPDPIPPSAPAASIVVSPASRGATAAGESSQTASVTANVAWTATSDQAFITISNGASGNGNGTVTYSVAANSGSARVGRITISGGGTSAAFTVEQAGVTAAALGVAPLYTDMSPDRGTSSLAVTTSGPWTAVSDRSFLTIVSGASGSGNGTIMIALDANFDAERVGTILVTGSGTTVAATVHQQAPYFNPITLRYTGGVIGAEGLSDGTATVEISSGVPVPWTAASSASFVTITSGGSGTNDATLHFAVAPNGTGVDRQATLTVSAGILSKSVTISQLAVAAFLRFEPDTLAVGPLNTPLYIVPVRSNVKWSVTSSDSWLSIIGTEPQIGPAGDGSVTLVTALNSGPQRSATVTLHSPTLTAQLVVTQAQAFLTVSPMTINIPAAGGTFTTAVSSNGVWIAKPVDAFITIVPHSVIGPGNAEFTVAPNSGAARTGTFVVTGNPGNMLVTVTVVQAAGSGG